MDAFAEVRFPTEISYGSDGGPEFATDVVVMASGHEQRGVSWAHPRHYYNAASGVKTLADLRALVAFFMARRGRAQGFRFLDQADHEATAEAFGTGAGVATAFQLVKAYKDTASLNTYTRTITKPIHGETVMGAARNVRVYVAGAEATTGWTVDTATGIVTFVAAPTGALTWTGWFDVPVRFDADRITATIEFYEAGKADVPLVEVRV